MKRESKEYELNTIWPIFSWYRCLNCLNEFRREPGWSIGHRQNDGTIKNLEYLCLDCAPTEAAALTLYIKRSH